MPMATVIQGAGDFEPLFALLDMEYPV